MNHSQILKSAYDALESLAVENDDAGDALYDILKMLDDRRAEIEGAFEDEFGNPRDILAEQIVAMKEAYANDVAKERRA